MKTRRNHRKTTTGRRRRVVKQQRGQTRFHHRKGTVTSGRRHKFFKRGGEQTIDRTIQAIINGVEDTVKTNLGLTSNDTSLKLGVERISSKPSKVITNTPIVFEIDSKQIKFVIVEPTSGISEQSVYIYLDDEIYGSVMVTIGTKNMGSYYKDVATIIFNAINFNHDLQKFKQKYKQ